MVSKALQDRMGPELRCKLHFKKWAQEVRESNLAYSIPDVLIDTLPKELDYYVIPTLEKLRLTQRPDKLWERA